MDVLVVSSGAVDDETEAATSRRDRVPVVVHLLSSTVWVSLDSNAREDAQEVCRDTYA